MPLDAALWRFGELAMSGSGKTYNAAIMAEEMVKNGIPIVALDPVGVWWGLRVAVDSVGRPIEKRGLPVVIFGGDHADVSIPVRSDSKSHAPQVDEEALKRMVAAILESHISAVLDTSEFSKSMQRRVVTIFAEELYRLNRDYGTRHIFIEEADMVCPQRVTHDAAPMVGAIDNLVRRGGNFNLGSTLISQRPAVVNKDVLSQITCLIALRIFYKGDKDAVKTWVEAVAGEDQPKVARWYESLTKLKDGEAWVWNPIEGIFDKVQFRKRETLHATREYFRQQAVTQSKVKVVQLDELITKFRKAFEPKPKKEVAMLTTPFATRVEARPPVSRPFPPVAPQKQKVAGRTVSQSSGGSRQGLPRQVGETSPAANAQSSLSVSPPLDRIYQTLPTLELLKLRPTVQVETSEPVTALGRVLVVLANGDGTRHYDRWSNKKIGEFMVRHGWATDGADEAVTLLLQWEILTRLSSNALRFDPARVKVIEETALVQTA